MWTKKTALYVIKNESDAFSCAYNFAFVEFSNLTRNDFFCFSSYALFMGWGGLNCYHINVCLRFDSHV